MSLMVEAPGRLDLSFRTNADKRFGARWTKSDNITAVPIDTATVTLRFDLQPAVLDDAGDPVQPPAELHVIDGTDPDDPDGWIDAGQLTDGVVLVTVPHGIWPGYVMRSGDWDMVTVGDGIQTCLLAGVWIAEEGVSS